MSITSKELNYLTDHVKNEALLTHLCTQASVECIHPQFSELFMRLAEERCRSLEELSETIQKYADYTH